MALRDRTLKLVICDKCGHSRLIGKELLWLTPNLIPLYRYVPDTGCPKCDTK